MDSIARVSTFRQLDSRMKLYRMTPSYLVDHFLFSDLSHYEHSNVKALQNVILTMHL